MRRKPIELAAIATAAVPGLTPTAVSSAPDDPADFDSALLLDSEGKRWRVRSPRHAEASARLETEFLVLRAFAPGVRAELPFLMPTVAGSVRLGALTTFVYSHLSGSTRSVEELTSGPAALGREIGSALAAIHDLPRSLVSNADLPSYTPNEFRQRRLNELDQAATTGKIPATLLRRWEHAMEDVSLWRFNPCVVHGDLHEDNLLVESGRVTAVTGWTDLRIGDPADDFAWLVASNEQDFIDTVLAAYTSSRRDVPDQHLLRRAALSAEFALAQYLVKGLATGDPEMVSEAEGMLESLASDIAEYGGQPISVEPLPAKNGPDTSGAAAPAAAGASATAHETGSGSSAVTPAVTVIPVPAQTGPGQPGPASPEGTHADPGSPAGAQPATVQPGPATPSGQARPAVGAQPAAQAELAGRPRPAVHVAPIPVEPPAAEGEAQAGPGKEEKGPDDTSTAAISVINVKQG
ncbi:phosphotransferase [Arthrobacter sp. FW306-05-C]|uniref:macrolide 2'-phosphotransferase n=1 Tax=Arthrobacter TaxID=1663 RepID=UPI001EF09A51|nr:MULTISPECIES: macrolide 2'-phosphotransferase [Arthrobacter]MDP9985139.1 aminoglycoside phosphotransferase (APT) family kinase protein [Arthrobacter oryzae]UKA65513.1 phosphotransferase [Arthrobacter sp. FW306-05-C]UKA69880.1 phosphotransferase [Arthrobacter sp. FW306-06-A]